jgi:hypothetical protein
MYTNMFVYIQNYVDDAYIKVREEICFSTTHIFGEMSFTFNLINDLSLAEDQ